MKRMFFAAVVVLALLPMIAIGGGADAFVGTWKVDYDATLKEAKKSPKYDPEKDAKILPVVLRSIADKMTLELTGDQVIFTLGEKQTSMPYKVKSDKDGLVVLQCKGREGREPTLTFEPRRKGKMNFKSSLTDDMDYYIWKPEKKDE